MGDPDGHNPGILAAPLVELLTYGGFVVIGTAGLVYVYNQQHPSNRITMDSVSDTIRGWFHPNNSNSNSVPSSPPPGASTNVGSGTPGITPTNVQTGTPGISSTPAPNSTTKPTVDQAIKDKVKANAGGKCEYCGKKTTTTADTASGKAPAADEGQTDHYCPRCKGGTDDESNLVHACRGCNGPGGKGSADPTDPNDVAGQRWRLPRMENKPPQQ